MMRRPLSKRFVVCFAFIALACASSPSSARPQASTRKPVPARITTDFDRGWRFLKADARGAEQPNYDDKAWRTIDVPHDWSIEGSFDRQHPTGAAGGFLPAGVGWYRKHFTLPAGHSRRRILVEFDGVMTNSDVWINGTHLGKRPYGYVSFAYDLTPHLRFGDSASNVIAVRADNSAQPASRWYTGAGIYRHVRLIATDRVHIDHHSTFVTTPQVTREQATVRVRSTIVNDSATSRNVILRITLLNPGDRTLQTVETKAQTIPPKASAEFRQDIAVRNPRRWDIDDPALYRVGVVVQANGMALDDEPITFGIRDSRFDAATGFHLNDRNFKIKGVCLHHDASAFGAAVPLRAWERRLELLRTLGVNAIRTAHNPPAPEFLDLCDRMGFLVLHEMFDVWTVAKNPHDYHLYFKDWSLIDTRDTVRRDRNHPSIIAYSTGNEIHDTPQPELAKRILRTLVDAFHEHDPTRPVTQGLFRPNVSKDYDNGLADMLDVVGQNYRENEILAAHRQKPTRKILGTENTHTREAWLALRDNPPYAGQFLWSGIDYLGESPGYPAIAFNFGLLDRTGTPRPFAFQRQSWWANEPMVHITRRVAPTPRPPTDPGYDPQEDRRPQVLFSDWTPRDRTSHEENVEVYSNVETVELFLNGKSLGSQPRPADDAPRTWRVGFAPGLLRAVATTNGKVVATHELRTASAPGRIILSADRERLAPVWDDVSYVTATVVDRNGVLVPTASNLITFKIAGAGRIAVVDSGNNTSHKPFQVNERRAYQGRCFAMLKASAARGKITLTATAPGLTAASLTLDAVAPSVSEISKIIPTR